MKRSHLLSLPFITALLIFGFQNFVSGSGLTSNVVFDPTTYLALYSDLAAAFGTNQDSAASHWQNNGIYEGRRANSVMDPPYYLSHYQDLINAFGGNNYNAAANHFVTTGQYEGRRSSFEFDVQFFLSHSKDLVKEFGATGYDKAIQYWLSGGINDGRASSADFSVRAYLNRYPDLIAAFGPNNYAAAFRHWLTNGKQEGRNPKPNFLEAGIYHLGNGVNYYYNGGGHSCSYVTKQQPAFAMAAFPPQIVYDGFCGGNQILTPGQYLLPDGRFFYSNGEGQSCFYPISTSGNALANGVLRIADIPSANGQTYSYCNGVSGVLPPGQYVLPTGVAFFSNGVGQTCNYSQLTAANLTSAAQIPAIPPENYYDPNSFCAGQEGVLPVGQYKLPNGVAFFSNGVGQTCNYDSKLSWDALSNAITLPSAPPNSNYSPNNFCDNAGILPAGGNYMDQTGIQFYSNAVGATCTYAHSISPSDQLQSIRMPSVPGGNGYPGQICAQDQKALPQGLYRIPSGLIFMADGYGNWSGYPSWQIFANSGADANLKDVTEIISIPPGNTQVVSFTGALAVKYLPVVSCSQLGSSIQSWSAQNAYALVTYFQCTGGGQPYMFTKTRLYNTTSGTPTLVSTTSLKLQTTGGQ